MPVPGAVLPHKRTSDDAHIAMSYAPYTLTPSAACVVINDGQQFFGLYLENAAFDPSLSSMVAAVNFALLNQMDLTKIHIVALGVGKGTTSKPISYIGEFKDIVAGLISLGADIYLVTRQSMLQLPPAPPAAHAFAL